MSVNRKISNLPAVVGASILDADIIPLVASGVTSKTTISDLRVKLGTNPPAGGRTVTDAATYLANNAVFNVKDFGAYGDDSHNDTTAIQNAITACAVNGGGEVLFPKGIYRISALLTTSDNSKVRLVGIGSGSVLSKQFNGDVLSLGKECYAEKFYIAGNGASFTGRGIVISTGAAGETTAWRRLRDVQIIDTQGYCIEFTAAVAGYFSSVRGGNLQVYNHTLECIKLPSGGGGETVGNREFIDVKAMSGALIDIGDSQNTSVLSCMSGGAVVNSGITFGTSSKKARIIGNRFSNNTSFTVFGNEHIVVGNVSASDIIIGAAAASCVVMDNGYSVGVTDNSGNSGNITSDAGFHPYTPAWTSSGSAPAIGNGSINGNYTRIGRQITVWIEFTPGSTTTFGTGNYFLSLPSGLSGGSGREYVGVWKGLKSSATATFEMGLALITAAAPSVITLFYPNGIGNVTPTNPHTWQNGDNLKLMITYSI